MLMVVLGAGASFDSDPTHPPSYSHGQAIRPPLANQLFEDRPIFADVLQKLPRCQPIIPYLRHRDSGMQVERVLEKLQEEAPEYPERHRQLAAIRYYLHFALWQCVQHWNEVTKGVTNYKTLLDEVLRWRKDSEAICLVTFNYDTMLEDALASFGVEIRELRDYVEGDKFKLFKVHGSVNWAREVEVPIPGIEHLEPWDSARKVIDMATDLTVGRRYRLVSSYPMGRVGQTALYPAVAIPLETKLDFECPDGHMELLKSLLPNVTKILIIGWRGMEVHFLQLLKDNMKKRPRIMIVAADVKGASETSQRLQVGGVDGDFTHAEGGFTDFVVQRHGSEFLKG